MTPEFSDGWSPATEIAARDEVQKALSRRTTPVIVEHPAGQWKMVLLTQFLALCKVSAAMFVA
jgi:hypothetical protein